MRLLVTFLVLSVLLCLPFLIWGDSFERWFTGDAVIEWIRGWGPWGWLAVIGLLVSDLVLPIPATPVLSAAGYLYGPLLGGLIGATGSFLSGMAGYGLCRAFGQKLARFLSSEEDLQKHRSVFERSGPWIVAISRWLPLLPEVISCLAGLTKMPLRVFYIALACGTIPMAFTFAAIGAAGQEHPALAIVLNIVVPPLLWLVARRLIRTRPG